MKKLSSFGMCMLLWFAATSLLLGQDNLVQLRVPVHATKDLGQNWFLASWLITNVKQAQPNNLNFFGGIGYRGKHWWLEGLVQRQWNGKNSQWQMNFRYSQNFGKKWAAYAELYPVSSRHTFSEVVVLDYRLGKKWKLGGETENIHQKGPDLYGGGPRLSYQVLATDKVTAWITGTYHLRGPTETNFFRVYLLTNIRLH